MNIDELLNRYFEGETSAEEEQKLRRFFASDNVPENLSAYKPLFAYFDEEITAERDMVGDRSRSTSGKAFPVESQVGGLCPVGSCCLCAGVLGNQSVALSGRSLFLFR